MKNGGAGKNLQSGLEARGTSRGARVRKTNPEVTQLLHARAPVQIAIGRQPQRGVPHASEDIIETKQSPVLAQRQVAALLQGHALVHVPILAGELPKRYG